MDDKYSIAMPERNEKIPNDINFVNFAVVAAILENFASLNFYEFPTNFFQTCLERISPQSKLPNPVADLDKSSEINSQTIRAHDVTPRIRSVARHIPKVSLKNVSLKLTI